MEEKARWTEEHVRESLGPLADQLSLLKFHLNGTSPIDAPNQDAATVDLRIVAQGRDLEMFDMSNPHSFGRKTMVCILESAPVRIIYTSSIRSLRQNLLMLPREPRLATTCDKSSPNGSRSTT